MVKYREDIGYEEEYALQLEKLEEAELERLLNEGKVRCAYRTATTKSRNLKSGDELLEAQVYPAFPCKGEVSRGKKKKPSREEQKNLNDKKARRYLARLININFGAGDIWATFGWDDGKLPASEAEAKKQIGNYIRRLNHKRRKLGLPGLKYVYVLAFSSYKRPHFHIVMSGDGLDRDAVEAAWGKCGRPNTRRIAPDADYLLCGMAEYIARNPHGTKSWVPSKNLAKPRPPKKSWCKFRKSDVDGMARNQGSVKGVMEKKYPGYRFLDAEVRWNGVVAAFYVYARMVKNKDKPAAAMDRETYDRRLDEMVRKRVSGGK
jgi:hypothetical protein